MSEIANYITQFEAAKRINDDGIEAWSARELGPLLGYERWDRMPDLLERARAACANSNILVKDHFRGSSKMVPIGSGATRSLEDVELTRYAAYLVAMNGDPRKPEIAAAQTHFAVKTREAELAPARPAPEQVSRRDLALMIIEAEDRAEAAELAAAASRAALAEVAPKAESWDTLASADGDFSVGDAAKVLSRDPSIQLGQQWLFNYLGRIGWVCRAGDGRWRVKQAQVETGRLSEIPASHYHPRTGVLVLDPPQVRITAKGVHERHRRLGGTAPPAIAA